MSTFDIYVHGTPRGHQIWGSDRNHDYISTFYNHDSQASEKVVLQIDVCGGYSFYTYIRHQDVYDVEGRPQAFFALTVSFRNVFCTNVYSLYRLFDAVYNQICIGSILKQSGNEENYLVADLTVARSGTNTTVDKIKAAFTQKIAELIVPTLQPLSSGDTFNRTKKIVSLLEVDSPLFFDYFKKYSIVVSPNLQPSAMAYDIVVNELKQVLAQKQKLVSNNETLKSDVASLSQENKTLSDQLNASTSSAEKKYKNKLDLLQNDLTNITRERDSLKQKIDKAKSSIELIDKPFQTLTRLLAGRFPENSSSRRYDSMEGEPESSGKNQKSVWSTRLNGILLGLILACCCTILFVVLKAEVGNSITPAEENIVVESVEKDAVQLEPDEKVIAEIEPADSSYDSWEYCILNIKGGGDNLELNKEYTLSVTMKNGRPANIPQGSWSVYINKDEPINKNNSFIITDPVYHGKNIMIEYIVNDKPVKQRVCKIQ